MEEERFSDSFDDGLVRKAMVALAVNGSRFSWGGIGFRRRPMRMVPFMMRNFVRVVDDFFAQPRAYRFMVAGRAGRRRMREYRRVRGTRRPWRFRQDVG